MKNERLLEDGYPPVESINPEYFKELCRLGEEGKLPVRHWPAKKSSEEEEQ